MRDRLNRIFNFQTRIEEYGYHYSLPSFLFRLCCEMLMVILLGKLNFLCMKAILFLIVVVALLTPAIIIEQFHYLSEQKRFHQVTEYMELLMYSFQKHPKILSALEEVEESTDSEMSAIVGQMIDHLERNDMLSYEETFSILEKQYPCERLHVLHDFLIRVEQLGGNYRNALFVLIEDLKLWKERVYLFQKERQNMQRKINLSMFAVLLLCSVMFRILSQNDTMRAPLSGTLYQMASTGLFFLFFLLYVFSQIRLRGSWFGKEKVYRGRDMEKDWKKVRTDRERYSYARKKLEREVDKRFPSWLRDMVLSLQSDNVYRSLVKASTDVPLVMAEAMARLIQEISEDPVSMKPYNRFLCELVVPEVHSTMKMIYSYTNIGTDEAKIQLNAIMQRNLVLTDRAERLQNEDEIAGYTWLFYLPMLLGTAKIMMDMSVLFVVMFQLWGNL